MVPYIESPGSISLSSSLMNYCSHTQHVSLFFISWWYSIGCPNTGWMTELDNEWIGYLWVSCTACWVFPGTLCSWVFPWSLWCVGYLCGNTGMVTGEVSSLFPCGVGMSSVFGIVVLKMIDNCCQYFIVPSPKVVIGEFWGGWEIVLSSHFLLLLLVRLGLVSCWYYYGVRIVGCKPSNYWSTVWYRQRFFSKWT